MDMLLLGFILLDIIWDLLNMDGLFVVKLLKFRLNFRYF